jgi:hypothetical protein
MSEPRQKFLRKQDWYEFLSSQGQQVNGDDLRALRYACYKDIEQLRQRPLLVYAAKFVDANLPPQAPISIDLGDVDGFTELIGSIKAKDKSVDVLIHSPGGRPDATERIVNLLRPRFTNVTFLVPHSAYSAATMLALSGDEVIMHPSAVLGPIDPQINGIPARSIKRGFDKIQQKIKEEGPEALPAYIPLIEKYSLELLELCEDSEKLSKELVTGWLSDHMLSSNEKSKKLDKAVDYLASYDTHLLHSRPLTIKKLSGLGLNVKTAEQELSDLLWEAYTLLDGFFNASPFVKIFESTNGISWGKQFAQVQLVQPPQLTPTQPNGV